MTTTLKLTGGVAPVLTPQEADARMRAQNCADLEVNGWKFYMDGPMMSPPEVWAPWALSPSGEEFFVDGDVGDSIEGRVWVSVDSL